MITIIPHRGAGPISFGMTREQVVKAVGQHPHHRMKMSALDSSEIDFFDDFSVYYDTSNKSCAIEFSRGISQVEYDGYELFAHTADEVRSWAVARDQSLDLEDGFVSLAMGLSMYAPFVDEHDMSEEERAEPAQSFLVFRPGYQEEERKRLDGAQLGASGG